MKKTRILILLVLMLCFTMVLGSCKSEPKELKTSKVIDELHVEQLPAFTKAVSLSVSGNYQDSQGKLVLFRKTDAGLNQYTVYNLADDRVVASYNESSSGDTDIGYTVTLYETAVYPTSFYCVSEVKTVGQTTTYLSTLYDAEGQSIASAKKVTAPAARVDLIYFDNIYYRVSKDGKIAKLIEMNGLSGGMLNIFAASGKYYYANPQGVNGVIVLDQKKLQKVSSYILPDYAVGANTTVLSGGNILVQYRVAQPDDTEDYDLFMTNTKYKVVTLLVSAKNGTAKEIKSDYLFTNGLALSEKILIPGNLVKNVREFYENGNKNLFAGYRIQDRRVSTNNEDELYLAVDNGGSVKGILNRFVDGMVDFDVVAENVMVVTDLMGRDYLYNKKGKLIGEVTGAIDMNDLYVIGAEKIYDYELKEVYDYAAQDYEFVGSLNSGVIFSKDTDDATDYYLFANGNMTRICKSTDFGYVSGRCYAVSSDNGVSYYSDLGQFLVKLDNAGNMAVSGTVENPVALLRSTDKDGNPIYYRLTCN